MEYVLQTRELIKKFGSKAAVNGVNLNVKAGDIYGLIGRNGAGKTTLIRMAAGLAHQTKGSIKLFESDDLEAQRRKIGTMIENPAVFPHMTAKENLKYHCLLLGIDPDKTIQDTLNLVGLQNTGKKKAKNFSLGMKQRLAIAISLLGEPEFLMLDEPINGLDPTGIIEIRELVLKLNKEKKITILISSHILGELSKLATRYGVINNGIMVAEFTNEELKTRCVGELVIQVDNARLAQEVVSGIVDASAIHIVNNNEIRISKDLEKAGMINMELAKRGVVVNSSMVVGQDLEAYFMQLMNVTDKIMN
jgi:ABC-2 type transport system ATP-binding protein